MTLFTVEATTAPVENNNWTLLRSTLDMVPGTILLEDADEPTLVFPIEADSPMSAARFVEGATKTVGLALVRVSACPAPPA